MIEQERQYPWEILPFLCIELGCLPSEILKERYNDIEAIVSALEYRNKKINGQGIEAKNQRGR